MSTPFRIKDIRPGSTGSNPYFADAVLGDRLYFIADDGVTGREIWSTDGTFGGTRLLKDISPPSIFGNSGGALTVIGNRLYFRGENADGSEPWVSDGTSAGTVLLKDVAPGTFLGDSYPHSSFPNHFTRLGNAVIFFARDEASNSQLWSSDGTSGGTQLVQSFGNSFNDDPISVGVVGNQLLFWAKDGGLGRELWGVDSTLRPRLIKDINPGAADGDPGSSNFSYTMQTAFGERLFFEAVDNKGLEMWVSDGTAVGTRLLKDISPGIASSNLSDQTTLGNLFFTLVRNGATNVTELWRSDSSSAGTSLVKRFDLGGASSSSFNYSISAAIGGNLFIDVTSPNQGHQLWISNGSSEGTKLLKVINPGGSGGFGSGSFGYSTKTVVSDNKLFFTANDGSRGEELWVSDGTAAGTRMVKDIRPGAAGSISFDPSLTAAGAQVFFWANDGITGTELWRSDGTATGTQRVADLNPGPGGADLRSSSNSSASFFDYSIKVLGDKLIFSANDGSTGPELWALALQADPTAPTLALSALSASKAEGRSGATPFTFKVTRSGNSTGSASVRWGVSATGSSPASSADFASSALPSGTVSFAAGQTSQTITVNVAGDLRKEGDETFRVTLTGATGATISTATAIGTILNDDLIGDANRNRLVGTARAEFIDGRANVDTLTGGAAADVFGFRFGESKLSAPDSITDFAFGTDKIDLFAATGGTVPAPLRFSRAASNSTAKTLAALSTAVFTDANGALRGNQALGANSAVLVQATNAAIAGTYLLINNSAPGRSDSDDLMIKLNGFSGALPGLGAIGTGVVFV